MRNNKTIDFVGKFKILICISLAIIIVGTIVNIVAGTKLDINFSGGTKISYSYSGDVSTDDAKATIEKKVDYKVSVSQNQDYTTGSSSLAVTVVGNKSLTATEIQNITKALTEKFPKANVELAEQNSVDPTVGSSFFGKSMWALFLACVLVAIYVGIRFRKIGGLPAAITAIIALIHDAVIAYFAYILLGYTIGDNFIAVMLTILGYSLNDTIVIYDRVRENNLVYGDTKGIRDVVNISVTQSFKRTLITSITTFIAISCVSVVAAIAGLDSILSFSVPMSVGVVSGSYSSICIAGPLYVFWNEFKAKHGIGKKSNKKGKKPAYVGRMK